ncbi:hypothetical protein [Enterovibrio coralii]|uniref:Uncharacterized protein n=1 Tax=Enterovibrio coralii TaxID=294935 RepID=A0A135IBW9_9GAMM|nr:hypothetical protein [Enterovibrio coralii]KXF82956.1 hypothetical protein ATN88_04150 [Enterovibrio coralii]
MKVCVAYTKEDKRNKITSNLTLSSLYHGSLFVQLSELETLSNSDVVILYDSKYVAKNAADVSASLSLLKANNNCVAVVLSCRQDDRLTGVTTQICRIAGADSIERIHNTYNADALETVISHALRLAQAKDASSSTTVKMSSFSPRLNMVWLITINLNMTFAPTKWRL